MRIKFKLPVAKKNSKFGKVKESIFNFFSNFDANTFITLSFTFAGLAIFFGIYGVMKANVVQNYNSTNYANSSIGESIATISTPLSSVPNWIFILIAAFAFWFFIRYIFDSVRHEYY